MRFGFHDYSYILFNEVDRFRYRYISLNHHHSFFIALSAYPLMNIKYLLLSYCIFEHKVCCGGRCGLAMSIRFQFFVYRHTTRHVDKTLNRALTIINCMKLLSGSESLLAVYKIVINYQWGLETMYHFMINTLYS